MKRFFDIVGSICLLALAGPVMLVIAAAVFVFLGLPVFFVQQRVGLKGRLFNIIKFRTMNNRTDGQKALLADHERLGRFGRLLRRTSLDELPELLNVLKGDMSLVGPRPLLTEYMPLYTPRQARRHEVRPGLTGWAQVNGRNALSWEERLEMDVWYVDHQSFWLDVKILCLTVLTVLTAHGISHGDHTTMPKFRGDRDTP